MESTFKRSPHYTKRGIKAGDIVVTRKGNKVLILSAENCGIYYNVQFLRSGVVRTGLHCSSIAEVYSESR